MLPRAGLAHPSGFASRLRLRCRLVCDDREHDEVPEDDWEEDTEVEDAFLAELAAELFGLNPLFDAESKLDDDNRPPSAGERVLYALGQLHRLHLAGSLPVPPSAFAIEDLVRILGVVDEMEFASEERGGRSFHFPSEVLHIDHARPRPWRLLGV